MDLDWTFMSNYGHVLFLLARKPDLTVREVAIKVGITERAAQRIISTLEKSNYLKKEKVGRRNRYQIDLQKSLKHPIERSCKLQDILDVIVQKNQNVVSD